jgi:hypothetical protein
MTKRNWSAIPLSLVAAGVIAGTALLPSCGSSSRRSDHGHEVTYVHCDDCDGEATLVKREYGLGSSRSTLVKTYHCDECDHDIHVHDHHHH